MCTQNELENGIKLKILFTQKCSIQNHKIIHVWALYMHDYEEILLPTIALLYD